MKLNCKNLQVVLFDWDGTLAQSDQPRVFAINKVLQEYNLPEWNVVMHQRNDMLSFLDNFPNIFGTNAKEAYCKFCQYYTKYVKQGIKSYANADKIISFFRSKGIKVALMTNKDRQLLEFELPMLYPVEWFDKIVCGHEAPRDKPYGDQAIYTLNGLIDFAHISPETVWIIGDSKLDNLCASSINALPIRINTPFTEEEKDICKNVIFFQDYLSLLKSIS